MKEKFVAKVPEHLILQPVVPSSRTMWSGRYNVALWLRMHQLCPGDVNLVLKYMDHEGVVRRVVVDQSSLEFTNQILLSGEVTVPAVGRVIDMSVYLEMPDNAPGYTIDELYLQSNDRTNKQSAKIISAA